jgi:hypothetical protein
VAIQANANCWRPWSYSGVQLLFSLLSPAATIIAMAIMDHTSTQRQKAQ